MWSEDEKNDVWVNGIALMEWKPEVHISVQYHRPKATSDVVKDIHDFRSRIRKLFPSEIKSQWVFSVEHGERWEQEMKRRKSDEKKNRHAHILVKYPEGSFHRYEEVWAEWRKKANQNRFRPASIVLKEIETPPPSWNPRDHAGVVLDSNVYLENVCLYLFKESSRTGFWVRQHHRINYHGD
jgi:hypothetical protein